MSSQYQWCDADSAPAVKPASHPRVFWVPVNDESLIQHLACAKSPHLFLATSEASHEERTRKRGNRAWRPTSGPCSRVFFRMPVAGDFLRYIPNRELVHRLPNLRTWMGNGKLLLGLTLWWSKVSDQEYNSLKFSMVHKQAPSFLGHFVPGLYLNK